MEASQTILKLIDGLAYTYDRQRDIIYVKTPMLSGTLNRTQISEIVDVCIEVTNRCNFACPNCFSESKPGAFGAHLESRVIREFLRQRSGEFIRVAITGGEPFMHPDINDILSLPSSFEDCGFVISTNGEHGSQLDRLLIEHRWLVAISLMGTAKTHNEYTHSESFNTVVRRIERLSQSLSTHIYTVLHAGLTVEDIDWLYRFRDQTGIKFLRFIVPRQFGRFVALDNEKLLDYVRKSLDDRSGLKTTRSNTLFVTVDGHFRVSE